MLTPSLVESGAGIVLCTFPYLAPAPSAVVSHNSSDEINECFLVCVLVLVKLDASRRGIVLALVYQPSWVGRDGVVNKNIHMIFGGEQCADIAVERKVGAIGEFDRFYHLWLCLMDELAYLIANRLLPIRKCVYIFIDTRIFGHLEYPHSIGIIADIGGQYPI